MNIHTSPASQRNGARHADGEAGTGQPHDIKYRQDAASYVAAMLAELRQIAGKAGFDKVVKSLDAAYYEAYSALDGKAAPPSADAEEKSAHPMEPNGA